MDSFERALRTLAGLAAAALRVRNTPSSPTPAPPPACTRDGAGGAGMVAPAGEPVGMALGRSSKYERAFDECER